MRNVIDRLRPREEKRFWAAFDDKIEHKRQGLRDDQSADLGRLEEKLKTFLLRSRRQKESEDAMYGFISLAIYVLTVNTYAS